MTSGSGARPAPRRAATIAAALVLAASGGALAASDGEGTSAAPAPAPEAAPAPAGPPAEGDARRQVEMALQEYARLLKATDNAGISGFYAPDGELLLPGRDAVKGPDSIHLYLASFGKVQIESASMAPESTEVHGDMALQWGAYSQLIIDRKKQAASYRGRFVAQWSRQPDGRWLIRRLMMQPSPQGS